MITSNFFISLRLPHSVVTLAAVPGCVPPSPVYQAEPAHRVGLRRRVRAAGQAARALTAGDAVDERAGILDRCVDRDVVERQRAVRREHLAGERGRARRILERIRTAVAVATTTI